MITIRLKTEIIRWATFGDISLSEDSPLVTLSPDDADKLLAHPDAHILEVVDTLLPGDDAVAIKKIRQPKKLKATDA
jgi:hypothetical protein